MLVHNSEISMGHRELRILLNGAFEQLCSAFGISGKQVLLTLRKILEGLQRRRSDLFQLATPIFSEPRRTELLLQYVRRSPDRVDDFIYRRRALVDTGYYVTSFI